MANPDLCMIQNLFEKKICSRPFYTKMLEQNKRKKNLNNCVNYLCDMLRLDPYEEFKWTNISKIKEFLNVGINIYSTENNGGLVFISNNFKWNIYLRYNHLDKTYGVFHSLYRNNQNKNNYVL